MVIHRRLAFLVPLALGLGIFLFGTRGGVAIYPDSVLYIQGARSLALGQGLTVPQPDGSYEPVTLFPPLYSLLLASASHVTPSVLNALKPIQLLLLLLALAAMMTLAARSTNNAPYAILLVGLLGVIATDFMSYQTVALSEGLFIACTMFALCAITSYLSKPSWNRLLAAALATSAAWLSRYAGAAWVLSGAGTIVLLSDRPWRKRLFDALVFIAISSAASVYWMIRNARVGQAALGRTLRWTGFWGPAERDALQNTWRLWTWRWSTAHAGWVAMAVLIFLILLIRSMDWRRNSDAKPRATAFLTTRVLLLYSAVYLFVIAGSAMAFQADILLDSTRILIAFHLLLLLFIVVQGSNVLQRSNSERLRAGAWILSLFVLTLGARASWAWLRTSTSSQALMYATNEYRDSPLIASLKRLPPNTILYSNLGYPVLLYTGRVCFEVPRKIDNGTGRPSEQFERAMKEMKENLEDDNGLLVLFNKGDVWLVQPTVEEISARVPLQRLATFPDGTLWRAKNRD